MDNFIQFENIHYNILHPVRTILENIHLKILKNDFIIILGSNGSGKSSLLKLLDQRYSPTFGDIYINNKNIATYKPKQFAKLLITLSQNPLNSLFPSLTVLENCLIASRIQRKEKNFKNKKHYFENYLMDFNINLPKNLANLVCSLSGGEQQALALALACLARPDILLLDEHTSALDPHASDKLMDITNTMIKRYQITCLLTTHNLDLAIKYGNRLIALKEGKIMHDYNSHQKKLLTEDHLKNYCY